MRRQRSAAPTAILAVGLMLGATAAPAVAKSGKESIRGTIVTSGVSGSRTVVSSLVATHGVFDGIGRDVELASRPGDAGNVLRDDFVFPRGRMHIIATGTSSDVSVDPMSCLVTLAVKQTGQIAGGTGRFRHASGTFAGAVHGWAVATRDPDGSCSQTAAPVLEVDVVTARGTLTL
jgi:hypothetical protein